MQRINAAFKDCIVEKAALDIKASIEGAEKLIHELGPHQQEQALKAMYSQAGITPTDKKISI